MAEGGKYWYNLSSGEVEFGPQSLAIERVGPFDTEAEAARALETLRERSQAWAEEDAAEEDWGGDAKDGDEDA